MIKRKGLIIIGLFLLDLLTKTWVLMATPFKLSMFGFYKTIYPTFFPISEPTSFFNLILTWNNGVSFSMFANNTIWGRWLLVLISMAVTIYVSTLLKTEKNKINSWAFILIIAGAIGNIFDRIRYGAVIDFLDFHLGQHHWPAFNLADIFISCGMALIILQLILESRKKKTKTK